MANENKIKKASILLTFTTFTLISKFTECTVEQKLIETSEMEAKQMNSQKSKKHSDKNAPNEDRNHFFWIERQTIRLTFFAALFKCPNHDSLVAGNFFFSFFSNISLAVFSQLIKRNGSKAQLMGGLLVVVCR